MHAFRAFRACVRACVRCNRQSLEITSEKGWVGLHLSVGFLQCDLHVSLDISYMCVCAHVGCDCLTKNVFIDDTEARPMFLLLHLVAH